MKKTRFLAMISVLSIFCQLALTVPASADALIKVASNSVSFGQVKQGETASAKFQVTNAGKEPLTIQFMEFSMPGMRANVKAKINAGSSTEILVTWNTSGISGEVKGETILTFDDPQGLETVLTLTGTVVP